MRVTAIILALVIFSAGCKKDTLSNDTIVLDGYIHWGGSPAADGTSWSFYAEGAPSDLYFLKNLPSLYQVANAPVRIVMYKSDEKFACFCYPLPPLYVIEKISFR